MVILDILQQIATLPLKVAQGMIDVFNNGQETQVNLTVTIGGRKVGADTRIYLFDAQDGKGTPAAKPVTPESPAPAA
jgi:hypothetical protein